MKCTIMSKLNPLFQRTLESHLKCTGPVLFITQDQIYSTFEDDQIFCTRKTHVLSAFSIVRACSDLIVTVWWTTNDFLTFSSCPSSPQPSGRPHLNQKSGTTALK